MIDLRKINTVYVPTMRDKMLSAAFAVVAVVIVAFALFGLIVLSTNP